jgi:hypothetical protein
MVTLEYLARRYRVKSAEVKFLRMAQRLADEGREILRRASVQLDWERFSTPAEWAALLLDLRALG